MSFHEQREFETIDGELAALEESIARCKQESERCASDYVKLLELDGELEKLSAALEEKTERWVYLTELAEQIAAQGK